METLFVIALTIPVVIYAIWQHEKGDRRNKDGRCFSCGKVIGLEEVVTIKETARKSFSPLVMHFCFECAAKRKAREKRIKIYFALFVIFLFVLVFFMGW